MALNILKLGINRFNFMTYLFCTYDVVLMTRTPFAMYLNIWFLLRHNLVRDQYLKSEDKNLSFFVRSYY